MLPQSPLQFVASSLLSQTPLPQFPFTEPLPVLFVVVSVPVPEVVSVPVHEVVSVTEVVSVSVPEVVSVPISAISSSIVFDLR